MNVSAPFIRRPVGTTLLAVGLFLLGATAYFFLPVASLPAVDFPTISVSATRPGADPATMAASVAAPLERRLANISGLMELTSTSSQGSTQITAQFELKRKIDAAARDVPAAINAAATDLPGDLTTLPNFRKSNSSASSILVVALTSDTMPTSAIYDVTDTVINADSIRGSDTRVNSEVQYEIAMDGGNRSADHICLFSSGLLCWRR